MESLVSSITVEIYPFRSWLSCSAAPFCSGLLGIVGSYMMLLLPRKRSNSWLEYSLP